MIGSETDTLLTSTEILPVQNEQCYIRYGAYLRHATWLTMAQCRYQRAASTPASILLYCAVTVFFPTSLSHITLIDYWTDCLRAAGALTVHNLINSWLVYNLPIQLLSARKSTVSYRTAFSNFHENPPITFLGYRANEQRDKRRWRQNPAKSGGCNYCKVIITNKAVGDSKHRPRCRHLANFTKTRLCFCSLAPL